MAEHPLRLAMGASEESGLVYKPRYRINIKNVNFVQEEKMTGVLQSQSPPFSRPVRVAQPTVARAQSMQHIGFPTQGHRSEFRRNSCSWCSCSWCLELCLTLIPLIVVFVILRHQMGEMFATKQFNASEIPEKSMKTFADVKGCNEAKSELEEIVQYLRNPDKFTRLGGKLPKGVLLTGPPGTGKTLLAKAIAGEAGVPFFYTAGSEFEEVFVGVGARRVRSLFQAAKKSSPCVIFIDEIDAIGGNRQLSRSEPKETLNQLLVEMDGFETSEGVIVLASTNLPDTLDPALTRPGRFDRRVVLPNPDVKGRQEILDLYLQDKPLCDEVDTKTLARGTPGFTGADLANLVNMAAVKAAVDGRDKVCSDQLEFAKDKILMGAERSHLTLSEESRKLTAYHEGGHVVVAFHTEGADPIHKATILPRGAALGMVIQLPDHDETSISKMQLLARLDVYMGGRVAEEMIFGADQVTTGARSDFEKATALARSMVSECGMSDSVGPIFVNQESQRRPSQETQKNIDAEVVRLLKEAYERVGKLLKKHEADIHSLARALLEHETLNSKQITDILKQENPAVVEVSSDSSQTNALLGLSNLISFA